MSLRLLLVDVPDDHDIVQQVRMVARDGSEHVIRSMDVSVELTALEQWMASVNASLIAAGADAVMPPSLRRAR